MDPFALFSIAIVTAAVLSYANARLLKLPTTIGVMLIALGMSLGLIAGDALGLIDADKVEAFVKALDLQDALLDVLLAFLLFAGALHVDLGKLRQEKWVIGGLATVGVMFTTFAAGGLMYVACHALGLEIRVIEALLFGSLIAPTDPIAVLGILKSANAPKKLEIQIAGESLFNDGVGVVVFGVMLAFAGGSAHGATDATGIATLVVQEVGGAIVIGGIGGYVAYVMLKSVDDYQLEVLITLAAAMGLYSLALALHSSGPLSVVIAGLFLGNTGRTFAMSETTVEHVDKFWELVDGILNVVLFVVLGMEVLLLSFPLTAVAAGLIAIPLVLLARFVSVGGMVTMLRKRHHFVPHTVKIITWGGLRGGISIALALKIPPSVPARDLILAITYVVVVFSIVVQGLTIKRMVGLIPKDDPADAQPTQKAV